MLKSVFLLSGSINRHEHETTTGLRSPEVESSQMGTESGWFFFSLAPKLMHKLKYENEKFELLALSSFLQGVCHQNMAHSTVCIDLSVVKSGPKMCCFETFWIHHCF